MDKTMIIFHLLILKGLLIFCNHLYSQELYTKELHWIPADSSYDLSFKDIEKALEWSKYQIPFVLREKQSAEKWRMEQDKNEWGMVITNSTVMSIKKDNFYIVITVGCSGIPCQNFYIFKKMEQHWHLIASSQARLKEQIEIETKEDKIIFKTKSSQIGELPFWALSSDN